MNLAKRKSFQAGLVVLIALVIILAGAFAWYSFSQQALNIFEGFTNPGVNIIDDYEDGKANKDVYVENSGEQPLYVRVRFDEFMEINKKALDTAWNKDEPSTWHVHDYMGASPDFCTDDHDMHTYYKWVLGDPNADKDADKGWKYYLPAPFEKRALFDSTGKQIKNPIEVTYYEDSYADERILAQLYGSQNTDWVNHKETAVDTYARIDATLSALFDGTYDTIFAADNPTATNADYLAHLYSVLDAATAAAAIANAQEAVSDFLLAKELGYYDEVWTVNDTPDYFEELVEYTNYFDEGYNGAYDDALVDSEVVFVPIKRTLTTQKVYTMDAWIKAGMPGGEFWVVDEDGWCYWASVLLPGDATGLLLSEVILDEKNRPAGSWWYGINVTLEATTYDEINKLYGDPTTGEKITSNGVMLLDMVSGNYVFDLDTTTATLVDGQPIVYTFSNNNDNTYRLKDSADGEYAPLFVYTGTLPLPVPTNDKGNLIKASATPEYAVASKFSKHLPGAGSRTVFTILDAGEFIPDDGYSAYGSGVLEVSGKRYILLGYGAYDGLKAANKEDNYGWENIAWLAVGPDGTFDKLTGTTTKYSDADDVLIWTSNDALPGTGYDRYVEDESKPEARIGQLLPYTIDGHEWLVLGFDGADGTREALLISKEVLATGFDDASFAAEVTKFTTSGVGPEKLEDMLGIEAAADIRILTVKEAIDYFADGRARIAYDEDGKAAAWWLSDGVISAIGNVDGTATVSDAGVRIAVWVNSDALSDYLIEESKKIQ